MPESASGVVKYSGNDPKTHRVPSEKIRISANGREHLVKMAAAVQAPDDNKFNQRPGRRGGGQTRRKSNPKRSGHRGDGGAGECADHIERTVRQVDQPHDAEHQGEARRHEKQHDSELQAVEDLLNDQNKRHS